MEADNLPLDEWCAEGPVRRLGADELEVALPEQDAVRLQLERRSGAIDLHIEWPSPSWPPRSDSEVVPSLEEVLQAAVATRSALLTGRATDEYVQLSLPVYLDRLGRHTFLEAAVEVARAHQAITDAVRVLGEHREEWSQVEAALKTARQEVAAATVPPAVPAPSEEPKVRVGTSTDLMLDDGSVVGHLEVGRWYTHGEEADGWLAVRDDQGVWGWVSAAAVVDRQE